MVSRGSLYILRVFHSASNNSWYGAYRKAVTHVLLYWKSISNLVKVSLQVMKCTALSSVGRLSNKV